VGSEDTRTDGSRTGSDEKSNVVRIPRDWFGPKDDLVPFGPSAPPVDGAGREGGQAAASPLDAETFWGEDADSVHDVLDGRRVAASARGTGRRTLLVAALVLLMAGAGLTTWLLGSPQRRPARPQIAEIRHEPRAPANQLQKTAAIARTRRPAIRTHPRPVHRHRVSTGSVHPTQVIYRPLQQATPSQSSHAIAASSASRQAASGATTSATAVAQPTSSSQVSQPAFGANGALGPMSSPAG
jgi:hypothetical protein